MAIRAQLSQERSRVRRGELLAAAIDLFAEGGARAITHRAVAARAGLPSATTTYYFESIDELIREALSAHVIRWSSELDALASIEMSTAVSLDDTAAFISAVFADRGPEVAALELSIFLAAARDPQLHDVAGAGLRALERLADALLRQLGLSDAADVAAPMVALIAGTAMRRQSGVYSEQEEARFLAVSLRAIVAAHALGPEVVASAIKGLGPTGA